MNDLLTEINRDSRIDFNIYETKDFYIASYLKAKGFKFTADKRGEQIYFKFNDCQAAHEAVKKLFRGNEPVSALDFITAIKNVKSIIHNI